MSTQANVQTYQGSCHCGAIRFRFTGEPITSGIRCNCSICIRKGVVWSVRYYRSDAFELLSGKDSISVYEFGERCVPALLLQVVRDLAVQHDPPLAR